MKEQAGGCREGWPQPTISTSISKRNILWLIPPIGACSYLLYSLIIYGVTRSGDHGAFGLIGNSRVPAFIDLNAILGVALCQGPLKVIAETKATCSGFGWTGYPALSMEIARWLRADPTSAWWIGMLTGSGVIALLMHFVWLLTKNVRAWSVITTPILLSFPVQLLLERSNIDTIIFTLVSLSCLTIWLPAFSGLLATLFLAFLTSAMKIYPLFGYTGFTFACLASQRNHRASNFAVTRKRILSVLAASIAGAAFAFGTTYTKLPPASGGFRSHGLLALGYLNIDTINAFGIAHGRVIIYAMIATKLVSVIVGLTGGWLWSRKTIPDRSRGTGDNLEHRYRLSILIVMTSIGTLAYLLSIGFDYRMVFLMPILAQLASAYLDRTHHNGVSRAFLQAVLASACYIMIIHPLIANHLALPAYNAFEIVDELLLSPFLCLALASIVLRICLRLPTMIESTKQSSLAIADQDY